MDFKIILTELHIKKIDETIQQQKWFLRHEDFGFLLPISEFWNFYQLMVKLLT